MQLITQQTIEQQTKKFWDAAILAPDDDIKELAGRKAMEKQSELINKLKAQKKLFEMFDQEFIDDLSLFDQENIYELLCDNTDEDTADEASNTLSQFLNILKQCI